MTVQRITGAVIVYHSASHLTTTKTSSSGSASDNALGLHSTSFFSTADAACTLMRSVSLLLANPAVHNTAFTDCIWTDSSYSSVFCFSFFFVFASHGSRRGVVFGRQGVIVTLLARSGESG